MQNNIVDPCFFMHIPKTAGTSFRHMLFEYFEQPQVFPNMKDIDNNKGFYPSFSGLVELSKQKDIDSLKLLVGHYPLSAGERVFPNRKIHLFTFLRNPITRTISHLYELQKHHAKLKGKDIAEIFENTKHYFFNLQVRMFSAPNDKHTEVSLEKAIENMKASTFVGLTEDFDNSILLLEKKMGWKFTANQKRNVNQKKKEKVINLGLLDRIIASNELDMEFYHQTKKHFYESLKQEAILV